MRRLLSASRFAAAASLWAAAQLSFADTVLPGLVGPPAQCDFFAAPGGTASGDGSSASPWDVVSALSKGTALSGKTVCLRGGLYLSRLESNLVGATVRSAPGEWAKIDTNVTTTLLTDLPNDANPVACTFSHLGGGLTLGDPGGTVLVDHERILLHNPSGTSANCLRGTSGNSVLSSHAAGSTAIAEGNPLTINGSDSVYRDFEIFNSNPQRVYNDVDRNNGDPGHERSGDVLVYGPRTKVINLVIHDIEDGIFGASTAAGAEFYGNIIFNNGLSDCVRGHGHGLYLQNADASQPKRMADIISFNNFATGMKGFGESGPANGMRFEGIISFNNGSLDGFPGNCGEDHIPYNSNARQSNLFVGPASTNNPAIGIVVRNNFTYSPDDTVGGSASFGYAGVKNTDITIQDNYFAGGHCGFSVAFWDNATVTGNTIYSSKIVTNPGPDECLAFAALDDLAGITWNNNNYFDGHRIYPDGKAYDFGLTITGLTISAADGGGKLPFDQAPTALGKGWRQWSGFDANSTYTVGKPTQNRVVVRANEYQAGRANIAVYNWSHTAAVSIDLAAAGLAPGQQFEIRNAQNLFGAAVFSGTYNPASPTVSVSTTDTVVTPPIGLGYTPASTCPEFCPMVLLPISAHSIPAAPTGLHITG